MFQKYEHRWANSLVMDSSVLRAERCSEFLLAGTEA